MSVHSTPRIVKPTTAIDFILPALNNDKMPLKLPFEYKVIDKNEESDKAVAVAALEISRQNTLQSARSTNPIVEDMMHNQLDQSSLTINNDDDEDNKNRSYIDNHVNDLKDENDNIFSQNLATLQDNKGDMSIDINLSQIKLEEDSKIDNDTSSLS